MNVIRADESRGALVLDISGRLTVLERNLSELVRQYLKAGSRQFILNLSGVTNIDSFGLGELVTVYVSVTNAGGTLKLLTPSKRVRKLLHISKLDTVFDILEDAAPYKNLGDIAASG